MLILVLAFAVAALAHRYLQAYAPSNAIIARARRERPRLRVAGRLVAVSTALAIGTHFLAEWAATGGPGWLHLIVLIAIWDAFKLAFLALAVAPRSAHASGRYASRRNLRRPCRNPHQEPLTSRSMTQRSPGPGESGHRACLEAPRGMLVRSSR